MQLISLCSCLIYSSSLSSVNMKSGLVGTRKRSKVLALRAASCLGKSLRAEQVELHLYALLASSNQRCGDISMSDTINSSFSFI